MRITKHEVFPTPVPTTTYTIEGLTEQQVKDILAVAYLVGGDPYFSGRKTFDLLIKGFACHFPNCQTKFGNTLGQLLHEAGCHISFSIDELKR